METKEVLVGQGLDINLVIPRRQQRGQVAGKRFSVAAGEDEVGMGLRPPVADALFKFLDFLDFIDQDVVLLFQGEPFFYVLVQVLVGDNIVPLLLFLVDVDDVIVCR